MVEAEVEAGMDGEVREPSVEVIEAPVEDPRMSHKATADEAGAVEGRPEPAVETRRGAEPTAAEPTIPPAVAKSQGGAKRDAKLPRSGAPAGAKARWDAS